MMYHYSCPVPSCHLGASDEVEMNLISYIRDHYQYHLTYDYVDSSVSNTKMDVELREIISDMEINVECFHGWQEERNNHDRNR
jgi:hypothetical protein